MLHRVVEVDPHHIADSITSATCMRRVRLWRRM
jgi:hypothetical protein